MGTRMGTHQRSETGALLASMISLVIGYTAMNEYMSKAPAIWLVSGRKFLASAAIIAISSFVMFAIGYARTPPTPLPHAMARRAPRAINVIRRIIEAAALSTVFAATTFFTSYALLSAANVALGRELFEQFTPLIVGSFASVAAYLGFIQASALSAKAIATMLPLFVISGVTVAALTSDDPWWWHNNFSQLGDRTTFAARLFNTTLIFAGVCIIIVAYFAVFELVTSQYMALPDDSAAADGEAGAATDGARNTESAESTKGIENAEGAADAARTHDSHSVTPSEAVAAKAADVTKTDAAKAAGTADAPHPASTARSGSDQTTHFVARTATLAVLLSLTGVCLIGVGCFRYTPHPVLHNVFARGMCVPIGLLLILLPWAMPRMSRIVYVVSDLILVADAVALLAWLRGQITLTAVEALACLTLFAWMIVFARQIAAMQADRIQTRIIALAQGNVTQGNVTQGNVTQVATPQSS